MNTVEQEYSDWLRFLDLGTAMPTMPEKPEPAETDEEVQRT